MLNFRVFVQSESGDRSMIWQGARPETHPGQEDRSVLRWTRLAADTTYQGQRFEMRFTNGDDSGCKVEGEFIAAQVIENGRDRQVEVVFSDDKHQVW